MPSIVILVLLLAGVIGFLFWYLRDEKPSTVVISLIIGSAIYWGFHTRNKGTEVQSRVQGLQSRRNGVAVSTGKRSPTESDRKELYAVADRAFEEVELESPFIQALKKYDTNSYLRMHNAMKETGKELIDKNIPTWFQGNISTNQIAVQITQQFVEQHLQKGLSKEYFLHASDEATLAFTVARVAMLRQVLAKDTDLCFAMLWLDIKTLGEKSLLIERLISYGTSQAVQQTFAFAIQTAATNPQPAPDNTLVQAKLDEVRDQLAKLHGDDVKLLANEESAKSNKKKACALRIEFIDLITKLPPKDASAVLRSIMADQ